MEVVELTINTVFLLFILIIRGILLKNFNMSDTLLIVLLYFVWYIIIKNFTT